MIYIYKYDLLKDISWASYMVVESSNVNFLEGLNLNIQNVEEAKSCAQYGETVWKQSKDWIVCK